MSSKGDASLRLIADTVRAQWRGTLVWILGGAATMYVMALGLQSEMSRFEGGPKALAASVEAAAQAMRLLRWPPERLDTLGGYLTFHNLTLFAYFLSLYAAMKGAAAIRGAETAQSVEQSSRYSRPAIAGRTWCGIEPSGSQWSLPRSPSGSASASPWRWLRAGSRIFAGPCSVRWLAAYVLSSPMRQGYWCLSCSALLARQAPPAL